MAVAGQNTRRPPARPENYCESKQTYFSYSLDKAFTRQSFQQNYFYAKLSGRFLLRQPLKLSFKNFSLEYRTMVISPAFFHLLTERLFTNP